jgi:hypothetical protein
VWVSRHCGIMKMKKPTHLQEWDQVLLLWGRLVFRWHIRVSSGGSGEGHCPLNKHLHNMGLVDEPMMSGIEDEPAFYLLCNCLSRISLRVCKFSKPILSVEEYEGASATIRAGKWQIHCDSLIRSFL